MNKGKLISLALIAFLSLQGCSAFQPKQESVTIIASTQPATVYIDNNPVGTSPVTLKLDRNKSYAITAEYDGRHGTAVIERKISGTGILDIVGTFFFIIPVIGIFTPGFWDLDPTTVHIQIPQ